MKYIYRCRRIAQSRYCWFFFQGESDFNVLPVITICSYDTGNEVFVAWLWWRFGIEKEKEMPIL